MGRHTSAGYSQPISLLGCQSEQGTSAQMIAKASGQSGRAEPHSTNVFCDIVPPDPRLKGGHQSNFSLRISEIRVLRKLKNKEPGQDRDGGNNPPKLSRCLTAAPVPLTMPIGRFAPALENFNAV